MHFLGDPTGECLDSCGSTKVGLPPGSSSSLWDERLEMASGMGEASAPGANSFQKGHKVILAMCAIVSRLTSREEAWVSLWPTWPCFNWLAAARVWGRPKCHSMAQPAGHLSTS